MRGVQVQNPNVTTIEIRLHDGNPTAESDFHSDNRWTGGDDVTCSHSARPVWGHPSPPPLLSPVIVQPHLRDEGHAHHVLQLRFGVVGRADEARGLWPRSEVGGAQRHRHSSSAPSLLAARPSRLSSSAMGLFAMASRRRGMASRRQWIPGLGLNVGFLGGEDEQSESEQRNET
jgi:hypothetical protein